MPDLTSLIREALMERFGEELKVGDDLPGLDGLARIAVHRVRRRYLARDVAPDLLRLLCACARRSMPAVSITTASASRNSARSRSAFTLCCSTP